MAKFGKKHKVRVAQRSHVLSHGSSTGAPYLLEVVLGELVSNPQQFTARVSISKSSDAQAIGRVQLSLKELAAGLLDLGQLEKASSWQQGLDIPLFHSDLRGVGKVNEQFHGPFVDVSDHDFCLPTFRQLPSEHGSEVRAAGWQDHPVGVDLLRTDYQHHIAQLPVLPEKIDDLQSLSRVLVGDVGHACRLWHPFRQFVGISECAAAGHVHSGLSWSSTGTPAAQDRTISSSSITASQSFNAHTNYRCKNSTACSSAWERENKYTQKEAVSSQSVPRNKQMPTFRLIFISILYAFYDTLL